MPAPRSFTATAHAVRDIADRALEAPEGLVLTWWAKDHGLTECSRASRSFQVSFCSLRNKADRQQIKHSGDEPSFALDIVSRGKYGRLACVRSALPNDQGYTVRLCASQDVLTGVVITDAKTGEEIKGESPTERRMRHIVMAAQNKPDSVTQEDFDWLEEQRPGTKEMFRPWFSTVNFRPDLYRSIDAGKTFVGQDAILDELTDDDILGTAPNE